MVRRGVLLRIGRGIYVRAAVARQFSGVPHADHLLRAAAAVIQTGSGAVISHRSAALLHGLDLIGDGVTRVTITAPPQGGRHGGAGIHLYTTPMPPEHVTTKCDLPATTVARTVIDLARTLTFIDGVLAADSALRKGLTSKDELRAVLAAGPRRRGTAQAARVVAFADGLAESALESIARVVFRDCGLPPPALQVWLPPGGQAIGRADFYWDQYKTIAEVDGALKYEDPARAKAQLRRDKRLREAGYEVVHFDWREITTSPAQVAASIRAAFRRGGRPASTRSAGRRRCRPLTRI